MLVPSLVVIVPIGFLFLFNLPRCVSVSLLRYPRQCAQHGVEPVEHDLVGPAQRAGMGVLPGAPRRSFHAWCQLALSPPVIALAVTRTSPRSDPPYIAKPRDAQRLEGERLVVEQELHHEPPCHR